MEQKRANKRSRRGTSKTRVIVVGAGGHGQVVADILLGTAEARGDLSVVGYLDDDPRLAGRELLGVKVLGRLADLASTPHDALIIAIGNNDLRHQLATRLGREGETFFTARHPSAVVAPDVSIGAGSVLCGGVVVNPGTTVGAHVILNTGSTVDHHNHVGDYAHIGPGAHLGGDVEIGAGTLVGIGSTVLPRRAVGGWAVVGAGAVVTSDVPSGVTVVGVPARLQQFEDRTAAGRSSGW